MCAIASPTHSETPQNRVETDIAVIKTEIKNLKDSMDTGIKNLKDNMNTGFANVQQNFADVQKDFDRLYTILIYFIGVPLGVIAIGATIWGISAQRRGRKEDSLQKQIESLTAEIEALKKQRSVE